MDWGRSSIARRRCGRTAWPAYVGGVATAAQARWARRAARPGRCARLTIPGPRRRRRAATATTAPSSTGEPAAAGRARRLDRRRVRRDRPGRDARRAARRLDLARRRRPVRLHLPAVVGVDVGLAAAQVDVRASRHGPDVAVIFIGGQRRHAPRRAAPPRCGTWATRCAGCARRAPRWSSAPAPTSARSSRSSRRCAGWPGRWSRQLAAAQTVAVVEAGGRRCRWATCSARVRRRPGPDVRRGPVPPVRRGVRAAAAVVLPTVLAALGRARRPRR